MDSSHQRAIRKKRYTIEKQKRTAIGIPQAARFLPQGKKFCHRQKQNFVCFVKRLCFFSGATWLPNRDVFFLFQTSFEEMLVAVRQIRVAVNVTLILKCLSAARIGWSCL